MAAVPLRRADSVWLSSRSDCLNLPGYVLLSIISLLTKVVAAGVAEAVRISSVVAVLA